MGKINVKLFYIRKKQTELRGRATECSVSSPVCFEGVEWWVLRENFTSFEMKLRKYPNDS